MPSDYLERFEKAVPADLQAAIALAILAAYRAAALWAQTELRAFGWREALGTVRWFFLQEKLLELRDRYPALETITMRNQAGTHVFGLAHAAEIYFTLSKVERPDSKPAAAEFRRLLQSPVQLSWLEDWSVLPRDGIYALLIHGPNCADPSEPAFVQIKFMDGNDGYLPRFIDLYQRYLTAPSVERAEISRGPLVKARRHVEKKLG